MSITIFPAAPEGKELGKIYQAVEGTQQYV
jgi:hypothetical protein